MKTSYNRWVEKVNKEALNGCWEWQGAKTRGGYGHFRLRIGEAWKMYKAHRFSYEYHWNNGHRLSTQLLVCHKCDNPKCVNPDHLFVGTAGDNQKDKLNKGRHKWGRTQGHNLLSFEIAEQIRKKYDETGLSMAKLGIMFNTSASQVCRIINNKIWKAGTEN